MGRYFRTNFAIWARYLASGNTTLPPTMVISFTRSGKQSAG
jgi:hypothetical protein